jgi:hypothetical protein
LERVVIEILLFFRGYDKRYFWVSGLHFVSKIGLKLSSVECCHGLLRTSFSRRSIIAVWIFGNVGRGGRYASRFVEARGRLREGEAAVGAGVKVDCEL